MKYFCRYFLILTALGALFCSCGGGHNGGISGEAGEPEFLRIADRAEGGWTIVSVSPFDGSADTLVVDKPMTNIIVMSTSHYGFLDAIGRTDIISGISGPDYLWINSEQKTAEASSGGSTASLCEAPPLASLRSAPVPPLTVPRVAWVSPSRLASAAYTIITGFSGGAAAGLASPDHGRPRHARGRGPDRWRGSENLFSQTLREMGGAERSEESGLAEPALDALAFVSITVTNEGPYDGTEVVQLYVRDEYASVTRPVKELKAFKRVSMKAGESAEVTFAITPEMLQCYGADNRWSVEPGDFTILVGSSSDDKDLQAVTLNVK